MENQQSPTTEAEFKTLVQLLEENNCLKFGEFTLKSGAKSKYYIDLRESTFSPRLFNFIVEAIKKTISHARHIENGNKVAIVGVPYGVVPIAGAVAYELKLPYFPVRKETKNYGNQGDSNSLLDHEFILIEDVMSTGSSIIETIKKLEGKRVTDVIVIIDREAGGADKIKAQYPDIKLHSILKATHFQAVRL